MKLTLKSNKVQVLYSFLNCMFPSFSRIRQQEYFQAAAMLGICSCVSCTLETCSLRIEGDVVALHWLRTHLEPNHSVCSFKKKKGRIMGSVMLFHTLRVPTFQQSCLFLLPFLGMCPSETVLLLSHMTNYLFPIPPSLHSSLCLLSPLSLSLLSQLSLSPKWFPCLFQTLTLCIINLSLCLPPPSFRLLPRLQDRFPQE